MKSRFLAAAFAFSAASFLHGPLQAAEELVSGTQTLPPLPEGAFTLVVIPDTQSYYGKDCPLTPGSDDPVSNPNLEAQVEWILRNKEAENIVFVTHVGDIVDKNNHEQWAVAKQHLDRLHGVVPFALTVGNHDMDRSGDADLFQRHFPESGFSGYAWYLEGYRHERSEQQVSANNVNSAQVFDAGGVEFLHLSLECNAPDDVLAWAGGVLRANPDRLGIITTHMDLGIENKPTTSAGYIHDPKGRMRWTKVHNERGNSPEQMWEKLYRKHPNLRFVLSGDQRRVTAMRRTDRGEQGKLVYALQSDYMSQAVLRLMRFVPDADRVDIVSYEVSKGFVVERALYVADEEEHVFTLNEFGLSATSIRGL